MNKYFWAKVSPEPNSGCWLYTGFVKPNGYGEQRVSGRLWLAHRLSWAEQCGPIPEGMCVCHSCDNRLCVNPAHLFLGTYQDNHDDMTAKGRRVVHNLGISHCKWGHAFTDENTRWYGTRRQCKKCNRAAARRLYQRRKAEGLAA